MRKQYNNRYISGFSGAKNNIPDANSFLDFYMPSPDEKIRLKGEPPPEIRDAIGEFIKRELGEAKMRSYEFRISGNQISIYMDQKFSDVKRVSRFSDDGKGILRLYGDGVHLKCKNFSQEVDYADPQLFDHIERFINFLPARINAS